MDVNATALQVVIFSSDLTGTTKTAVENYLANSNVSLVVVASNETQSSMRDILGEVVDERVAFYSNPKPMGEGAAWKALLSKSVAPVTIIHGTGVCSETDKINSLVDDVIGGKADAIFATTKNNENGQMVASFRSTISNKFCTTLANMGSNLNISDLFDSSIIIKSDLLQKLSLEQDGTAVRVELATKLSSLRPATKIFEVGVGSSSKNLKNHHFSSRRNVKSALWGVARYSKLGDKIVSWRSTAPTPAEDPDHTLTGVLEDLSEMKNYPQWIVRLFGDRLGSPILEVGAGHGSITEVLAEYGDVVAFDTSTVATKILNEKFSDRNIKKIMFLLWAH